MEDKDIIIFNFQIDENIKNFENFIQLRYISCI